MNGVVIENRDSNPFLKTYDRPDALFYLDPPYLGTEKHYEGMFGWKTTYAWPAKLKELKGRFVLSYNDDPRIRELYGLV
ncbi:MAG: DNA adenine methylase [Ruthenibacterium lactatiformans]